MSEMKYNLLISNSKFNEDGFLYHSIECEIEEKLKTAVPSFEGFLENNLDQVLCYSVSIDKEGETAILFAVDKIVREGNLIKIYLKKQRNTDLSCKYVKGKAYSIKCRYGLKNEGGLYVLPIDNYEFGDLCHPADANKKHSNLLSRLTEYKSKSNWKYMVNEFGDLSLLEKNHPEFWNSANLLDQYLVFPLSHLVTAGDKYKMREKLLPYFLLCIDRVLELFPNKFDTLTVYAYFYYCDYMDTHRGHKEEDFEKAETLYKKILEIDPNHIKSLYRLAKLYQIHLNQIRFVKNADRRQFYLSIRRLYSSVISQCDEDETNRKKYEYEYVSSIYNLLKFEQETFLDYERVFFESKIYDADVSHFLTGDKATEIKSTLDFANKLMGLLDIGIDKPISEMIKPTKKNQIDVFYRVGVVYQSMAYYCEMTERHDDFLKYCRISNDYVKIAFEIYFARVNKGLKCIKPNYLFKMKATNSYLLGFKEEAIESLLKGKSDSVYRAGELLFIDKDFARAKFELGKIQKNDKLNMYNKAERLIERITNV